jgi:DNA polymerase-3 subunit delta
LTPPIEQRRLGTTGHPDRYFVRVEGPLMKLRFRELAPSLEKHLAPIYLIAGDEPLQLMQAADTIRAAARMQDYDERLVLDAEAGFDWNTLRNAVDHISLFAQRRILDLRMPAGKPGPAGSKALVDYALQPPADTLLLVQTARLDRSALGSIWLKVLDRAGVIIQVWPLNARETVHWIAARLAERGFRASDDAISVLAERAQGNLLAASQEIDKLDLLHSDSLQRAKPLNREQVLASVADSARFNVFDLVDAALGGDCARAVRILRGLAAEECKPPLVLWALAEPLRLLAAMSSSLDTPPVQAHSVSYQRRLPLLKRAHSRHTARGWQVWLRRCAHADRIIKGHEPGESWDELLNLTLGLCGKPLFEEEHP